MVVRRRPRTRRNKTRPETASATVSAQPHGTAAGGPTSNIAVAPSTTLSPTFTSRFRGPQGKALLTNVGKGAAITAGAGAGLFVLGKGVGALGQGLGAGFAGTGEGLGAGLGAGLDLSLSGLGSGSEKAGEGLAGGITALLPILLIAGLGFLVLQSQ